MKRFLLPAAAALLWVAAFPGVAHADDTLKRVQQSLRDQGFYYGSIDGAPGDETTQALRRYQIRNGLQVTGQLNDETRAAILRNDGSTRTVAPPPNSGTVSVTPNGTPAPRPRPTPATASTPRPVNPAAAPTPRPSPVPPVDSDEDNGGFRRGGNGGAPNAPAYRPGPGPDRMGPGTADDSDEGAPRPPARPDLRVPPNGGDPEARAVPPNGVAPSSTLTALFEGTPYEFAPPPVQADTLRRAQNRLLRQGFYDRDPDGRPNPVLAEALTNFQGFNRLRRTGRLDTATLAALRLLPAERARGPFGDGGGVRRGGDPDGVYPGRVVQ